MFKVAQVYNAMLLVHGL